MYKVVIGLEIHCELKTKAKAFSKGENNIALPPNTNLSEVDLGMPGVLPILNKQAVKSAIQISHALNCTIADTILFDRKNYFYADLPKGFQITQSHKPFGINGYVMINVDGIDKKVLISDLHMEEDTASLDHFEDCTLANYSRAGIPLIEIVTEPCLNNSKEVYTFLDALRKIIVFNGVSDARMDKGEMRCDVNISLMKETDKELGTKVEIKNISSFTGVKEAIDYEINRQSDLLDEGKKIIQETRRFDDVTKSTISMREKVEAVDYKYFIEPNIPEIKLDEKWIQSIKEEVVPNQYERVNKYLNEYKLERKDAASLAKEKEISDYFEEVISKGIEPKTASNWVSMTLLGMLNKLEQDFISIYVTPTMLSELINITSSGKISSKQAKEVLEKSLIEKTSPSEIIEKENLSQNDNDEEIRSIIIKTLENSPEMIKKYKEGRNVLDYFIGQVMKETRGKANPKLATDIVKEEIIKY